MKIGHKEIKLGIIICLKIRSCIFIELLIAIILISIIPIDTSYDIN